MKKLLIILLVLCIQHSFAQQRELDAFKYAFLSTNGFNKPQLDKYYGNLIEFSMVSPKSKLRYGFLFPNGKIFKAAEFDFASEFVNGRSNIKKDSVCGLLFENGDVKYYPRYKFTYFTDGKLGLAKGEKKFGFISLKGELVIPMEFDDAFPFYNGYAAVKKGDAWSYINEKGENVLPDGFKGGYQPVIDGQMIVYSNKPTQSRKIGSLLSNMVEYVNNLSKPRYQQSLYDIKSKKFSDFEDFDEIAGYYVENHMVVLKNSKYGLISRDSKLSLPTEYDEIGTINNGLAVVKKIKWGVVNLKNEIIIPFEYDKLSNFNQDLAMASKGNSAFYINKLNQVVIDLGLEIHWFGNFEGGMAAAKKNGKFGFIDIKGNTLIPFLYDQALPFKDENTLVYLKENDQTFFINRKGDRVFGETYSYLWPENQGFIRFAK